MKKYFLVYLLLASLFASAQNVKISDMTSATSLSGSEFVPIVQTTNKKATVGLIRGWTSIGTSGQTLRVNGGGTGLEFYTPSAPTWASITGKPNFDALYWKSKDTTNLSPDVFINGGDSARLYFANLTGYSVKTKSGSITSDYEIDPSSYDRFTITSPTASGIYQRGLSQFSYTLNSVSNTSDLSVTTTYLQFTQNSLATFYADGNGLRTNRLRLNSYSDTGAANNEIWYNSTREAFTARRVGTDYSIPLAPTTASTSNTIAMWDGSMLLKQSSFTIPTTNGSNGQVLTTNGSGAATWQTPSGGVSDGDKGDITVSGSGATWTIDNDAVTNTKAANMAANTIKVRPASTSGDPVDMAIGEGELVGRGTGSDISVIVLGTNLSMSGNVLNATGGTYYAPTTLVANATDANFTATVNGVHNILDGVATANRVITIPTGANGDVLEFYNTEDTYTWSFTGATVYLADRVTVVTELLFNVPCFMKKIDGIWVITN